MSTWIGRILVMVALIVAVVLAFELTIVRFLRSVEEQSIRAGLDRATLAFSSEGERIAAITSDWGLWDHCYAHAQGTAPDFVEQITEQLFIGNHLHVIAVVSTGAHRVTIKTGLSSSHATFAGIQRPQTDPQVMRLLNAPGKSSVITTEHGALLAVSAISLTSDGRGPGAGWIIMGRLLDETLLTRISHLAGLPISLTDAPTMSPLIVRDNSGNIHATSQLANSLSPLGLHVSMPRSLMSGALAALGWATLSFAVVVMAALWAYSAFNPGRGGRAAPFTLSIIALTVTASSLYVAWGSDQPGHEQTYAVVLPVGVLFSSMVGLAVWAFWAHLRQRDRLARFHKESLARQSAEVHAAMFAHLPMLAWCKNAAGRYVTVNNDFAKRVNKTPESIVGLDDHAVLPAITAEQFLKDDQQALDQNAPVRRQGELVFHEQTMNAEWMVTHLRDPDGASAGWVGFALDNTARERAQVEQQSAQEIIRVVTQAADIGVWELDPQSGVARWDDSVQRHHKRRVAAPTLTQWLAWLQPAERPRWQACLDAVVRSPISTQTISYLVSDPDGSGYDRRVTITVTTLRRPDGSVRRIVGASRLETDASNLPR